jgi:hypothetical protein
MKEARTSRDERGLGTSSLVAERSLPGRSTPPSSGTTVLFPLSPRAAYDGPVKLSKLVPADVVARLFLAVAAALSASSAALALPSIFGGDFGQGLLLVGVAVFAGWMAMAIHQFQQRLAGIDEVVRQGRRRVEQSEAVLEEMRRLAKSLRAATSVDDNEEDRTVH